MKTVDTLASDILTAAALDHASGGWLIAAAVGLGIGFGVGAILGDTKPFTATLKPMPVPRY